MSNQYTLITFLEEYEVRIPIIQRDYVQGREDEKGNEVRKNLIRDIRKCLQDEDERIDFNFIYGTNKGKEFFPVDGQQRLTTLYLLHWYLSCFCDADSTDFNEKNAFSYKTRNSATEFFAVLHQPPEKLREIVRNPDESLKIDIINEAWFQAEWANDPTVDAALTFLNDLSKDKAFRGKESEYYQKLKDKRLFYFTVIVEEGEQAERKAAKGYIRMNARGKALEQFENVKAMLDSIEEKVNKEKKSKITNFILKYDTCYVKELFKDACGKSLKDKTEIINRESMNYLIKLYLLLSQWQDHSAETRCTRADYVSEIYEYSHSVDKEEERDFFEKYFRLLTAIFEYYLKDKETVKCYFELEEEAGFCMSTDRKASAIALYIYYYYVRQNKTLEKEQMDKFLYVLENLNYAEWSKEHFVEILDNVAKFVAKKDDILKCFIEDEDVSSMQKALEGCELLDYKVRIKEQGIKVKICADNDLNWDFFSELEEKGGGVRNKLQYLFYISNYWGDYSQGDYEKLEKFKEIAETYFLNENKELDWRKHYAVAVHMKDDNKLSSAEEINKLYIWDKRRYHIWDDKFYFWSDKEEESASRSQELLCIKWIYEQLCDGKSIEAVITENKSAYDKCWLYHALKGQQKELLTVELEWYSKYGIIYALDDNDDGHRYDLYIEHINEKNPMQYGIKDLALEREIKRFTFNANQSYEGRVVDPYQNYNISLKWKSKITGLYTDEQEEQSGYYEPKKVDEKMIFTVLEAKEPYVIGKKEFDVTEVWEEREKAYDDVKTMVKNYENQDWLNIKDDAYEEWVRPNKRQRTWNYKGKGKIQMEIPYCQSN